MRWLGLELPREEHAAAAAVRRISQADRRGAAPPHHEMIASGWFGPCRSPVRLRDITLSATHARGDGKVHPGAAGARGSLPWRAFA